MRRAGALLLLAMLGGCTVAGPVTDPTPSFYQRLDQGADIGLVQIAHKLQQGRRARRELLAQLFQLGRRQRAGRKLALRARDQQHAGKADGGRDGAVPADPLAQDQEGQRQRPEGPRMHDRHRIRQRQP
jgi:hypothetical protein